MADQLSILPQDHSIVVLIDGVTDLVSAAEAAAAIGSSVAGGPRAYALGEAFPFKDDFLILSRPQGPTRVRFEVQKGALDGRDYPALTRIMKRLIKDRGGILHSLGINYHVTMLATAGEIEARLRHLTDSKSVADLAGRTTATIQELSVRVPIRGANLNLALKVGVLESPGAVEALDARANFDRLTPSRRALDQALTANELNRAVKHFDRMLARIAKGGW